MSEETTPKGGRLDALRKRFEQAERQRKAAEDSISAEEREELALRRSLADEEEKRRKIELDRRNLDLARRVEAMEMAHPNWKVEGLIIDDYPDSFVLRANQGAYAAWSEKIAKAATDKKIDRQLEGRKFAVASVVDWNGEDLTDELKSSGEVVTYLEKHPGIADAIINTACQLVGVLSKRNKS